VTISDDGRELAEDATGALARIDFGLPGLTPAQARSLTATIARLRAVAGDIDRAHGSAPADLG
jgi:hypothetical protein